MSALQWLSMIVQVTTAIGVAGLAWSVVLMLRTMRLQIARLERWVNALRRAALPSGACLECGCTAPMKPAPGHEPWCVFYWNP